MTGDHDAALARLESALEDTPLSGLEAYLAASWFVLQVVETLAGTVGLPDWVGPGVFVLLAIGPPIMLITAWVQGGVPLPHSAPPQQPVRTD